MERKYREGRKRGGLERGGGEAKVGDGGCTEYVSDYLLLVAVSGNRGGEGGVGDGDCCCWMVWVQCRVTTIILYIILNRNS